MFDSTLDIQRTQSHTHSLTHTHSHTYTHSHTHSHTRSHIHTHTHTHKLTHTHSLTHSHTHSHTHSQIHSHTHTHSLTHTHTHTHSHTHTHMKSRAIPVVLETGARAECEHLASLASVFLAVIGQRGIKWIRISWFSPPGLDISDSMGGRGWRGEQGEKVCML